MTTLALPGAFAQDSADWQAQVNGLDKQVSQLEDRYLKPALLRSRYKVESRYNDAKVAYLLKDYARASILFVGLVDNPRAQKQDTYPESLYLLGDSLFKQRNYLAARKYLEKVVARGPGKYYQEAVVELLELAAKTGNYEGVDKLYDTLDANASVSPAVNYLRGKTLYRQKRFADARRYFQKAAAAPDFALRAAYFRGVSFAAQGQLDNAAQVFQKIVADAKADTPQQQEVIDLTYLALGRISYEKGDYDQAVDHYQHLKRTSPYFDQMLYELTWTLIAQKKFKAASRVTDIFLYLSNPDPTFVPKVKLLKADLHLHMQQYQKARAAYSDVIQTFTPVKKDIDGFVDDTANLQSFFSKLVDDELNGEKPEYMPPLVEHWVNTSGALDKAKTTVHDLATIHQSIASSNATLDQMQARLESGTRIQSFPKLAEGMTLAVEMESRLISLRQDMIEAQYHLLASAMTPAEKQQWDALEKKVSALRGQYEKMPKTKSQVRQRAQRIDQRFGKLRRELDEVSFEIDSQKEELDGIDDYLANGGQSKFSAEQIAKVEKKKKQARARLAQLRELQKKLRNEVDIARQKVGVGDRVSVREQAVREQYAKMLARQRDFLQGIQSRSTNGHGAELASLRTARQDLPRVESRLQRFFSRMNELVGDRTKELRRDLASERKMLAMLDRQVTHLMGESKQVTAGVAYHSFLDVKKEFRDIIMRGDIGLIDVAWRKKEDMTQKINQLYEDRTAELKTLQEAFDEVR